MDGFFHCHEMGQYSWRFFAKMLLIADRITIWSPTYEQIADAHKNFGLPYTPPQFLELVRRGLVKVACRPRWLNDPSYREVLKNRGLSHTGWYDDFDRFLLNISNYNSQQVQMVEEPVGVEQWVDDQIKQKTPAYVAASTRIKHGHVPSGWAKGREIAIREGASGVNLALTTARNHYLATNHLKCTAVIEGHDAPGFFTEIGGVPELTNEVQREAEEMTFLDVVQNLHKIKFHDLSDNKIFNRHLDLLLELRESSIKPLLQDSTDTLIRFEGHLRSLREKIHDHLQNGVGKYDIGKVSISISSAMATAGAGGAMLESIINRKRVIWTSFCGLSALSTLPSTILGVGDLASEEKSPPEIHLNTTQRAALIMLHGFDVSTNGKIGADLAQELARAMESALGRGSI